MKKKLLLLLTLGVFTFGNSQKVYEWYQDGVVIFQIKTDSKYHIPSDKYDVQLENVRFLQEIITEYGITKVNKLLYYHPDEKLNHTFQVDFSQIEKVEGLIEAIKQNPFIEYAEKKELHVKFLTPNDMGANSTNGTGMWHLYTMQAQQAWDLSTGSASVVVAVTDDAIRTTHPDLNGKFVAGNDASDQNSNDPNPCNGNDGNHGTHVSGTVGATTNNGSGTSASLGWNVSIMPVKIGRCSDGALTAGYEGLAWAANNGADVINMSWGGGGSSNFAQNTVNAAWNQGAILVAAAGNDGVNSVFYPAGYNNVISVASTTTNDSKSGFSNFGTWIDISAPGSAIRSTVANNGYDRYDGTSMASPNVSSLLGLMKSYAPNATNTDLINCLYSSADPVTSNAGQMGAGRINAFQALNCVSAFALQTDAGITEIIEPTTTICGNSFTPQVVLRNFGANTVTSLLINYTWGSVNANFSWSGNLTSGQSETVSLPLQTSVGSGNFTFTATANLSGDQNGTNNSQSKTFLIDPNGQNATLTLTTDCYGSEITWNIINDQNVIVANGGPYTDITGGQTQNFTNCLPIGCYTFNINDSYGDGLYGSQWNCTVDGTYSMVDANGANLFSMTAPNGDFGNGTTHNFCIVNPTVINDVGISEIIVPNGTYCVGNFTPQVRIRNFGSNNVTSATINYNTGGANQSFSWSGNLSTGQTQVVSLANITANNGNGFFTATTTLPNGQTDQNTGNDGTQKSFTVYSTGLPLPFTETFESNTFTNGTWTLANPDGDVSWEIVTVAGTTPGTNAAKMDFFNYSQSSQRDGMISPMLNLNGYTSATMTWEHAYRRFDQSTTDSLIVLVSTDCGSTFTRVFAAGENSTGSFATAATNTNAFNPVNGEWCTGTVGSDCFSVDLTSFVGSNVFVKFEGFNSGTVGNNLYVDNINITGVAAPFSADFTAANSTTICPGESVSFTNQSSGASSLAWSFPGGSPNTSSAPTPVITYNTPGTYNAILTITGPGGTDTETKNNYVTVAAQPTVTISGNTSFCSGSSTTLTADLGAGSGTISTYQWMLNGSNIGSNQATLNANATGNYSVTVTNTGNCSGTSSNFNVSLFASPTVGISGNNTFCFGSSSQLMANATPGSGSITNYQWSLNGSPVGGNSSIYTATQSGVYNVIVINSNGCSMNSSSFTVNVNTEIILNITTTDANCDTNDGSASATANGNTAGYSFEWNTTPVSTGTSISNLLAGAYELTVTETATGCSETESFFINNLGGPTIDSVSTTAATCLNGNVGTAQAFVSGGGGNYTYNWGAGTSTTSTIDNIVAGTYSLTVTDGNSCSSSIAYIIDGVANPIIDTAIIDDATCASLNDGSIQIQLSGGSGVYDFLWSNGDTTQIASNLSSGVYSLTINDDNGCTTTFTDTVETDYNIDLNLIVNDNSANQGNSSIAANAIGGQNPYTFDWNNGQFSGSSIGLLTSGTYILNLTDANGCVVTDTAFIGSVGIIGNELDANLTLFPNPSSGDVQLRIEMEEAKNLSLSLINTLGQVIWQTNWNANVKDKILIPSAPYAKGIYFLKVQNQDKIQVLPFTKVE